MLQKGAIFAGRYFLAQQLGIGGFSEVWLAHDQMAGDLEVAIKVYAPGKGLDKDGLKLFSDEYSLVYNLNHAHLLKASHYDVYQGSPYLVLPYCSKGSAYKLLGTLSEHDAAKLMKQLASALEALHNHEPPVIHQDIKPENILINDRGNYLLTDFGISKKMRRTLTQSAGIANSSGTLPYLPPEAFAADRSVSGAYDVFQLGVTIYELITGELAFGENGGLALKGGADIPNLPAHQFSIGLNTLLHRCMALNAEDRPTAIEIVNVCDQYLTTGDWGQHKPKPSPTRHTQPLPLKDYSHQPTNETNNNAPNNNGGNKKWLVVALLIFIVAITGVYFFYVRNQSTNSGLVSNIEDSTEIAARPDLTNQNPKTEETNVNGTNQLIGHFELLKDDAIYAGVENPFVVAFPGIMPESIQVSLKKGKGTISKGSQNEFVATFAETGEVIIVAKALVNGELKRLGEWQKRVQRIPDPLATIGSLAGGNVPIGQFRAQRGVILNLSNFRYDVKFIVVGFQLTYVPTEGGKTIQKTSSSAFSPEMIDIISKSKAGDVFILDQVQAKGPDGALRRLPGTVYTLI